MSRKLVFVTALMFVLISVFPIVFRVRRVEAIGTIHIMANGSIDPPTANITSTDNITYTFTDNIYDKIVVERDNITIDGAGFTLQGGGSGDGILLDGISNVTIRNVEIREFAYGISLHWSSNISISGNNITNNNYYGVYVHGSSNISMSENKIAKNQQGIQISKSSNNTISGNRITENTFVGWANGVILFESSDNTISGNNITNNYNGVMISSCNTTSISGNNVTGNSNYGIYLMGSPDAFLQSNLLDGNRYGFGVEGLEFSHYLHSIDTSNRVDGKPLYYLISQQGITVNPSTHPEVGYLALINSTNITVEGLNLTKNIQGLLVAYTNDTKIQNNNITNNDKGVYFYISSNNTISGNNITNNRDGIDLDSSNNNKIYGNHITNNDEYAIALYESSKNSVYQDNITNNNWGIYLSDFSNNNNIYGNEITNSDNDGIYLEYCLDNTIYGNSIANNEYGIELDTGSSNNSVYHNNIINNTLQAYVYGDTNFWDNGVEGNYWSNYAGVDSDHDGIGDTVLVIGTNNTDNYPLMGMFHSFNASPGYYVNVISNSTVEEFQYFEANSTIRMYVSNMTLNQTFGFCRVCIPKSLMPPPYTVIIDDGSTMVFYFNGTIYDNTTHRWIYFAYPHSTLKVEIIPEFPTWTSTLLVLVVLTVATAICKRKLVKTPFR